MIRLIGILLPFAVWLLCVDLLRVFPNTLVPSFIETLSFVIGATLSGEIMQQSYATGYRWLVGFAIGVSLGLPCGILIGQFKLLRQISLGSIEYARSIPVTALIPLFLALFGIGNSSRIAMVALPTFLLVAVTIQSATRQVSKARCEMARDFNADELQVFWHILVPELMPAFFTAVRLALSLSLVVIIVSEMFVGTQNGVGQRIYESYMTSHQEALFGYLMLLGLVGLALNSLAENVERCALERSAA